jgi:hypothetical protein
LAKRRKFPGTNLIQDECKVVSFKNISRESANTALMFTSQNCGKIHVLKSLLLSFLQWTSILKYKKDIKYNMAD